MRQPYRRIDKVLKAKHLSNNKVTVTDREKKPPIMRLTHGLIYLPLKFRAWEAQGTGVSPVLGSRP